MASDMVRDGIFAVNKPCGQSSAQVVRDCQIAFNPSALFKPMIQAETAKRFADNTPHHKRKGRSKKPVQVKIGHGGTLDPLATGVLILGIGSATKALPQFLHCTKTYETTVLFGASSDTYDRVGRLLTKRPYDHITRQKVEEALEGFRGKQHQVPPLYSALKMNGKPLYEYAREGKPIPREIEGKEVEVSSLELLEFYEPGKHAHRWPTEKAEDAERNLAEQVWRIKKQQETGKKLTAEEKAEEDEALAAHESFKKKFEERQDQLIRDSPKTRPRSQGSGRKDALMSGALGQLPSPAYSNRGANLIPDSPPENTPPPWSDEGPPAAKIRLTVSSGYYVRSFCHDLGAKLESAALMAELCRVRQGDYTVDGINTLQHEDLAKGEEVWGPQVEGMLSRWNGKPVEEGQKEAGQNGRSQDTDGVVAGDKRRRSPSEETTASSSSRRPPKKVARERSKSAGSESWNGIED